MNNWEIDKYKIRRYGVVLKLQTLIYKLQMALLHHTRCGTFGTSTFPLTSGQFLVPKVLVPEVPKQVGYLIGNAVLWGGICKSVHC